MYRIIGISESGQLKLIKKDVLSTKYSWHSDKSIDVRWENSDLYKGLNGISGGTYSNLFVGSSDYSYMNTGSDWYNKIADTNWQYGSTTANNQTAEKIYQTEIGFTNKISAKIGLMYLHDYYYGMSGGNNCSSSGVYSTCKSSWLYVLTSSSDIEWLITRYGKYNDTNYLGWYIYCYGGYSDFATVSGTGYVRPVFYLVTDITLSGTGTSNDPYIIS